MQGIAVALNDFISYVVSTGLEPPSANTIKTTSELMALETQQKSKHSAALIIHYNTIQYIVWLSRKLNLLLPPGRNLMHVSVIPPELHLSYAVFTLEHLPAYN